MIKKKTILIFVLTFIFSFAIQSQNKKISISFNQLTKKEIFSLLEEKTNFKFYYVDSWINSNKISGDFKNESLQNILNSIFRNTSLNFTILNNRIILTKGNLIRESLYEEKEMPTKNKIIEPIYVEDYENISDKVIVIGKELYGMKRDKYTIRGIIKDKLSNKPLEGLIIIEKSKNISSTTNKEGFFSIQLPYGKNKLETVLLGYKSTIKNLIVFGGGNLNLTVFEESEMLDELVIKTKKENNVKEVIAGITQINIEEIKNIPQVLGERDILKVATTLPGIKSAGEGAEGVNVRGGKVDQNLFLLDESVMYNPAHFLGLFSAINPFTTSDLKVYKGNIPAEYGGRISSVFDIKTKKGLAVFSGNKPKEAFS